MVIKNLIAFEIITVVLGLIVFDLTIALEKMDCLQSSVKLFCDHEQLKNIRYVVPNLVTGAYSS